VFQLRHQLPALRSDAFEICLSDAGRRVFAYKRWNAEGNVVVVAVNLRHQPAGEIVVTKCGLPDGRWHEQTSNYDVEVSDGTLKDQLGPSEVKIFVKLP
jgi:1,4-alpha-glucan branching enzyme